MYTFLYQENEYIYFRINTKTVKVKFNQCQFKYHKVQDGDFKIVYKTSKSPYRNSLNHKIGDIVFINSPDKNTYTYDGMTIEKANQFDYDKYEFSNFKKISGNANVYNILITYLSEL